MDHIIAWKKTSSQTKLTIKQILSVSNRNPVPHKQNTALGCIRDCLMKMVIEIGTLKEIQEGRNEQ